MNNNRVSGSIFDILRVFGALCVFLIHFLGYRNIPVPTFVYNYFTHCAYGVCIFFVISGYLIMQSLERQADLKTYFVKRAVRIIPAYYVILIFGIIVWDIWLNQMPKDSMLHIGWLRYFLFLNTLVPSGEYYYWNDLWGLWTMSCFALFYVLAPIVKSKVKNYRQSVVMLACVIVVCYVIKEALERILMGANVPYSEMFAGDSAYFNMISFAMGVCVWFAVREGKETYYLRIVLVMLTALLLAKVDSYNRMIWSLITCGVIIAFKDFNYSEKYAFVGKIFKTLSKYSFTVYLVHFPIMQLIIYYSDNVSYVGYVPFLIISVGGTAFFAWFINTFVETPVAKLFSGKIKR